MIQCCFGVSRVFSCFCLRLPIENKALRKSNLLSSKLYSSHQIQSNELLFFLGFVVVHLFICLFISSSSSSPFQFCKYDPVFLFLMKQKAPQNHSFLPLNSSLFVPLLFLNIMNKKIATQSVLTSLCEINR